MVFYEKVIKLHKLELISDSAIYKNSMDYVRLNELRLSEIPFLRYSEFLNFVY